MNTDNAELESLAHLGDELDFLLGFVGIISITFISILSLLILWLLVAYIMDVTQTKNAIRRNYPIVGRFRRFFEHLGEFFRQYFFAMDREELPFNRAQRSWVYRAAMNLSNICAFGSTRDLRVVGKVLFANHPFPALDQNPVPARKVTIGSGCKTPYTTTSFFNISGMSYGALSKPAVQALSRGAHLAGCWLNTGEGGLSPYHLEGGADLVFQIGTAKYGVRNPQGKLCNDKLREVASHKQVRMFEIKLSQGAKPGKGGILPGSKVTEQIAAIRGISQGQDSISPNRHPEVSNNAELLDMIDRVRSVTGKPTGFKAVLGNVNWLDELFVEILNRGIESAPDFITVDSADGGSGAAPMSLMDDVGLPLRVSLPLLVDKLVEYGLRERVRIIASGKLVSPADVAWALCLGADFTVSARGFLFSLGCIQAMQCNKNTCPTGITTHDKKLQRGLVLEEKTQRVAYYSKNLIHEVGIIAHSCGVLEPRDLKRTHANIVQANGLTIPMNELYPVAKPH